MDTVSYILKKYNLGLGGKLPVEIPNVGRNDLANLLHELGFATGVEVGVAGGDYSRKLCEANPGMKLYGVDAWQVYDNYVDYSVGELDSLYEQAKKRLAPFPHYEILRGFSMDVVEQFEDDSLDFAYIDSNHRDPHITNDIAGWSKKVRPGGIVSGHDYIAGYKDKGRKVRFDVMNAVRKYAEDNVVTPWFILGSSAKLPGLVRDSYRSWFWVKPQRNSKVKI